GARSASWRCGRRPCRGVTGRGALARPTQKRWPRSRRPCPRSRTTNCAPPWRGWGPQSSEIDAAHGTRHLPRPLPDRPVQARARLPKGTIEGALAPIREFALIITRRAFTAALSLTGLAALVGFSPLQLIGQ